MISVVLQSLNCLKRTLTNICIRRFAFDENVMKTRSYSVNFTVVKSRLSVYSIILSDETKRQTQKRNEKHNEK